MFSSFNLFSGFKRTIIFVFISINFSNTVFAQNDLDAIRYSRSGVNGTSRFVSMGGAFGALGADLSCTAYNPAGIALFNKREACLGFGLKLTNNRGQINGKSTSVSDADFVFNHFGSLGLQQSKSDPESRHVFAFTSSQLQNFSNKVTFSNYTNSNSIAKDMLNIAQQYQSPNDLNFAYEGAGYNVYVLDYDTLRDKFFSYVDLKRTVLQTRSIVTSGRVNELNFTYAYSFKDKFYFGGSIGIPRVMYTSTTTHSEVDDKDSMRIEVSPTGSVTTTYVDGLEKYETDKLGFNSLTYTEYFTTTGWGLNVKLGLIARLTDFLRVGMHYHSPSVYTLKDVYYNSMTATFDKNKSAAEYTKYPEEGGYYNYNINTPSKLGLSAGFIIKKLAAIGIDYELLDYRKAQLSSSVISDFAGVNTVIKHKYTFGSNIRVGAEYNVKPVMLRAGYIMQGSPFGEVFTGSFVRHTISLGLGFRTKNNIFWDFVWYKNISSEDYYLFTTLSQKSIVNYNNSMLAFTLGVKF